jgi:TPR repeat protein
MRLGLAYLEGLAVPEDPAQAARLFAKACDADDGQGCYELASALQEGEGVAHDAKQATTLLRKACDLGYDNACRDDDAW